MNLDRLFLSSNFDSFTSVTERGVIFFKINIYTGWQSDWTPQITNISQLKANCTNLFISFFFNLIATHVYYLRFIIVWKIDAELFQIKNHFFHSILLNFIKVLLEFIFQNKQSVTIETVWQRSLFATNTQIRMTFIVFFE